MSDDEVEMFSELGLIGRWHARDMSVERSSDNWFKLRLDEDEWDFRPDDPTGFFLAAPLSTPETPSKRSPSESRALSKVSHMAIGAVLAVVLLTIGIVIGRLQLDGTELSLTSMLVLAAALGAGWASIRTSGRNVPERRERQITSLRVSGPRRALRVEDVLRAERQRTTGPVPTSPSRPEHPRLANDTADEAQDPPDPMPQTAPSASPAGPITGDGLTETTGDSPLTESSGERGPVPIVGPDPPLDVSSQKRLEEEPEDVDYNEPQSTPNRADGLDAQPDWIDIDAEYQTGQSVIDLHGSDANGAGAANDAGPQVGQSDDSILPTQAIKRYLASLSRLEAEARSQPDSAPATIEPPESHDSGAGDSADPGIALTEIRGIGPALSTALGQLGIGDVRDLAMLESDDLDLLQERLGRFGPRIRSERWVEQARQIVGDQ